MRRGYGLAAAAALAASAAAPSVAQDAGSFYIEAFGGYSQLGDTDVSGDVAGSAGFASGYLAGAALGYDYGGSPWRSELEFAYRTGDTDSFGGQTGDFASTTLLLNGYYDFAGSGRFTPYVGAGVGYVTEIDWDVSGGPAPGEYSDRGGVAWQLMAGAAYALSDRVSVTGELRYFSAGGRTLTTDGGSSLTADYDSLDVVVGLSLGF